MTTRASDIARPQTTGEEVANAISHGAGVAMGLVALPLLVIAAARRNDVWQVIAGSIYATTLVLLYGASTLYHALPSHFPAKRLFRGLDHGAIYLLIAGTYTPFALGALRGPWGWSILGTIWGLAAGGILLKAGLGFRYPRLSLAVYLLMGWLIVVALRPLYRTVGPAGMTWLAAGGASYTVGVYFYARDHLRYRHFVWHLFVLAGSVCHLVAVARYANGPTATPGARVDRYDHVPGLAPSAPARPKAQLAVTGSDTTRARSVIAVTHPRRAGVRPGKPANRWGQSVDPGTRHRHARVREHAVRTSLIPRALVPAAPRPPRDGTMQSAS